MHKKKRKSLVGIMCRINLIFLYYNGIIILPNYGQTMRFHILNKSLERKERE